ncbi:MAG: hypothetical protein LCH85_00625 [Chloroflexi bacterium]|nr:hypothetical protein [Chloroflexota bacterium]
MKLQQTIEELINNQQHCYSIADRECVYATFKPYQKLLQALAAKPNSPIEPSSIIETWHHTAAGIVIAVECVVAQQAIRLWIPRQSDFLDLRFLAQLNQHSNQMQYVLLEFDDQALIVLATLDQQIQLKQGLADSIVKLGLEAQTSSLLAIAEQRLGLKDYQGLIDQSTGLLAIEPTAPLYRLRGQAYYESGQIDAAWQDWAAAAQLGANNIYREMQLRYQIY